MGSLNPEEHLQVWETPGGGKENQSFHWFSPGGTSTSCWRSAQAADTSYTSLPPPVPDEEQTPELEEGHDFQVRFIFLGRG